MQLWGLVAGRGEMFFFDGRLMAPMLFGIVFSLSSAKKCYLQGA